MLEIRWLYIEKIFDFSNPLTKFLYPICKNQNELYMKIYIPIGSDCQVAHFLRNKKMRMMAFPFDWNCASLKTVYNLLVNNFDYFLEDIYVGERTHRLHFDDNEYDKTIIEKDFIYPVICKNYSILLPHDYKTVDEENLINVKQKYEKRIKRFQNYIIQDDLEIIMIYSNLDFNLNDWQRSVYDEFNIDIEFLKKENNLYIDKIKEFYKDKKNILIISLNELRLSINS